MFKQPNYNENHLNLIRLLAALGVLFSHSYALALGNGGEQLEPINKACGITLSYLSVDLFFVISGFLIAASAVKLASQPKQFAINRLARILPGLLVANIVTVIAVGMIFNHTLAEAMRNSAKSVEYIIRNSVLIFGTQFRIADAFANNPCPFDINGSLWTLRWEILCYIAIFLFIYVAANRAKRLAMPLVLGVIALRITLHIAGYQPGNWLALPLRFGTTFGIGVLFYYHKAILSPAAYALPFIVAAAIFFMMGFVEELSSPLVALSLLILALSVKGPLLAYNRLGDYSYGTYIYAFPIQQSLVHFFAFSPLPLALTSSAVTIAVAVASWHFVELPFSKLLRKH